jgi:hypothetical protein
MANGRRVTFDVPSSSDDVQLSQLSGNLIPPTVYRNLDPGRIIRNQGARGSNCECQTHLASGPTDAWATQFKLHVPARIQTLMEMTNVMSVNCESVLQQLNNIHDIDAIFAHEAAMQEACRVESEEEVSDAINAAGFAGFGFPLEIGESRITKQSTTTETTRTKRKTVKKTFGVSSHSATHVHKKVDTVELQTWFEGEDCYVATTDAGIFCGNVKRVTRRL